MSRRSLPQRKDSKKPSPYSVNGKLRFQHMYRKGHRKDIKKSYTCDSTERPVPLQRHFTEMPHTSDLERRYLFASLALAVISSAINGLASFNECVKTCF